MKLSIAYLKYRGTFYILWIKIILEQSPMIKNFWNVLQSPTVFYSGMFYEVLQYSVGKFFNIRESSRIKFFLLDSSIYIIEQYINLKYIKYQVEQITFKRFIFVINSPTLH